MSYICLINSNNEFLFHLQSVGIKVNPIYLLMPTTLCCSYAFVLPVGTAPNTIVYGASGMKTITMVRPAWKPLLWWGLHENITMVRPAWKPSLWWGLHENHHYGEACMKTLLWWNLHENHYYGEACMKTITMVRPAWKPLLWWDLHENHYYGETCMKTITLVRLAWKHYIMTHSTDWEPE